MREGNIRIRKPQTKGLETMTNRATAKMLRELGKIYLSILVEQQDVNAKRRSVDAKRKEAMVIGKKLDPLSLTVF